MTAQRRRENALLRAHGYRPRRGCEGLIFLDPNGVNRLRHSLLREIVSSAAQESLGSLALAPQPAPAKKAVRG
jgi:hypothetical protein